MPSDEGISGTRRMIADALADKIDLILTNGVGESCFTKVRGERLACYQCYFDGSHQHNAGGVSGCAFYVESDGHGLYSHVQHEKLQASHIAERRALYLLFMYIGYNIEPGSAVQVFGDAKGVIDSVKAVEVMADLTHPS
jgi:hypothetical protein